MLRDRRCKFNSIERVRVISIPKCEQRDHKHAKIVIHLKQDAKPLKQKQRRIAVNYQNDFDQMIEDMITSKKISTTHTSPWASQPRLLRKKDGSIKVTIDYQYLNSCTQKISYPFPFAEEIFARLTHAEYFTVIDLTSGYF